MKVISFRTIFLFLFLVISFQVIAQPNSDAKVDSVSVKEISKIEISAYIDFYYGNTFNNQNETVPYFVSHNSNNEFNINLAFVDFRYASKGLRLKFTPGFGTYMNANYTNESTTFKHVVEASLGVRLSQKRDIWLDAGVLGSPYTNETTISRDHLVYTRSLAAENVPYYLSGLKLSIPLSNKITFYAYLINGWQQIKDNNKGKSIGTQLEYKLSSIHTFNWNTYIGDERSLSVPNNRTRYFSDIFYIYNPDGKVSLTSCIYLGNQQRLVGSTNVNLFWWQANVIAKYKFNDHWSVSGRVEYFDDPDYVMILPLSNLGPKFSVLSESICINYKIHSNAMFRFEGRYFDSSENIFFSSDRRPISKMLWMVSNFTMWF